MKIKVLLLICLLASVGFAQTTTSTLSSTDPACTGGTINVQWKTDLTSNPIRISGCVPASTGGITSVVVNGLAYGATPTASLSGGILTLGIPAGAPGTPGTNGTNGTSVTTVNVTGLPAGSSPTSSYSGGVLTLGIPAGATGATGPAGVTSVNVTMLASGATPTASLSGGVLSLGIPAASSATFPAQPANVVYAGPASNSAHIIQVCKGFNNGASQTAATITCANPITTGHQLVFLGFTDAGTPSISDAVSDSFIADSSGSIFWVGHYAVSHTFAAVGGNTTFAMATTSAAGEMSGWVLEYDGLNAYEQIAVSDPVGGTNSVTLSLTTTSANDELIALTMANGSASNSSLVNASTFAVVSDMAGLLNPTFDALVTNFSATSIGTYTSKVSNTNGAVGDTGTILVAFKTGGAANTVTPVFRKLVLNDLSFVAPSATIDTTNAANIISGTLPDARLSSPNSSPGTCGDSTHVCAVTVDAHGRTTSQSAVAIAASGTSATVIAPSGDTTGATDTAAIAAAVTAGGEISLKAGDFHVTTGSIVVSVPVKLRGAGPATKLWNHSTTGNLITANYQVPGGTTNMQGKGAIIEDFDIIQYSGITPTSGCAFMVASSSGAGYYVTGLHINRVHGYGLWKGVCTGTGVISDWFSQLYFSGMLGGSGIDYNTPVPGGDMHFNDIELNGPNNGVTIRQGDVTEFTNLKTNGSGVTFTQEGSTNYIRFLNPSIESTGSTNGQCGFDFGTGSNSPTGVQIIGGQIDLIQTALCNTANATSLFYSYDEHGTAAHSSMASVWVSNIGGSSSSGVSSIIGPNSTVTGAVTIQGPGVSQSGNTLTVAANPPAGASGDIQINNGAGGYGSIPQSTFETTAGVSSIVAARSGQITTTQPTCSATGTVTLSDGTTAPVRNAIWFVQGDMSTTSDVMQVCICTSSATCSWVTK